MSPPFDLTDARHGAGSATKADGVAGRLAIILRMTADSERARLRFLRRLYRSS